MNILVLVALETKNKKTYNLALTIVVLQPHTSSFSVCLSRFLFLSRGISHFFVLFRVHAPIIALPAGAGAELDGQAAAVVSGVGFFHTANDPDDQEYDEKKDDANCDPQLHPNLARG